jgi:hypothetical protein
VREILVNARILSRPPIPLPRVGLSLVLVLVLALIAAAGAPPAAASSVFALVNTRAFVPGTKVVVLRAGLPVSDAAGLIGDHDA